MSDKIQDDANKKISDKQLEIWKLDMTIRTLSSQVVDLQQENERLKKCKDLSESIAKLPSTCLTDLKS